MNLSVLFWNYTARPHAWIWILVGFYKTIAFAPETSYNIELISRV